MQFCCVILILAGWIFDVDFLCDEEVLQLSSQVE
jgi:hypothetical protein